MTDLQPEDGQLESDEAFDVESNVPLISQSAAGEINTPRTPEVDVTSSRVALSGLVLISVPQIIAVAVVLSLNWQSPINCKYSVLLHWRLWSMVSGLRLTLHLLVIFAMLVASRLAGRQSRVVVRLQTMRNMLDGCGMLWFLLGNIWLFGDDAKACHHRGNDPAYKLSLVLLTIQYGQLCLPCIMALILLPLFCLCLPCIIRWLRRLQARREASKGASEATISALPTKPFKELMEENEDNDPTCAICLCEFETDERLRVLPCKHHFHPECVDEWLKKNSTCPSCRGDVNAPAQTAEDHGVELVQ